MLVYVAFCLALGVAIPVHVSINSRAGVLAGSAPLANAVFWGVGCATSLAMSAGQLAKGGFAGAAAVPVPLWLAGAIGAAISLSISMIIPKIGVGNATFLMLVGQMVASAALSHLGLIGSPRDPMTARKALGLAVMCAGLALFVFPPERSR
jgi:bacterial/archaeal transporter family-2 protein